jgi:rhomboid domain-containing protein 1
MVHLDAAHLLTNLAALLPDASALEAGQGSLGFGADLLLLALASSLAYIGSAVLHKELLGRPGQYYSMVTVGASSLGFALKVREACVWWCVWGWGQGGDVRLSSYK